MLRTLLYIPNEIAGFPVVGVGWALVLWLVVAGLLLTRAWRTAGWNADCSSQLMVMAMVSAVLVWVLPNVVEPIPAGANVLPPVAAATGIPIRGYGMMLLLGVVSGVSLAAWRARRAGLDPEVILALAFYIVIGGIVGVVVSTAEGERVVCRRVFLRSRLPSGVRLMVPSELSFMTFFSVTIGLSATTSSCGS